MNTYENENFCKAKQIDYTLDGSPTLIQKQRIVKITQELFAELLIKADRYNMLREQAKGNNYLTDLEKALLSFESSEADSIDVEGVGP